MAEKSSDSSYHRDIVLFDGVCNLCDHSVNFIIDHDPAGRFVFCSLQSSQGLAILKKYGLADDYLDSVILIRGEKVFAQSSAALEIARYLNGFWSFFYVFKFVPSPIRDFIYKLVAQNRYRIFGKMGSCRYPTPELKARFLND